MKTHTITQMVSAVRILIAGFSRRGTPLGGGGLGRRTGVAVLVAAVGCVCLIGSAGAECIDYGDYLHWVGSVDTPGSAYGVAVGGNYAYVADHASGLQVIDITNPDSPQIVGSVDTPSLARGVAISGTHVYIADWGSGLQVIDITNPESPQIVGSVDTPGEAWGVAVSATHAYVADRDSGLQVIDITNPESPQIVGSLDTPGSAHGVAVSGSHAYVADWGSGLQVIDITDPESPQIVGSVGTPGGARGVAVSGNYAYIADYAGGLQVIDITAPESPQIVGSVGTAHRAYGVAVLGTHAYIADYESGLQVIDITYPESPYIVGSVDTPGYAWSVAISATHAYIADTFPGLQVIDITNPEGPQIVGGVDTPGYAYGVAVSGSHAYVADYTSGLQVIDITTPESPHIVGSVDTPGEAWGVAVSGSHAYAADYDSGLQVIDITNPTSPQIVGTVDTPGNAYGVAVSGGHAYVADGGTGCQVIDIANPESPQIVGSVNTPGYAYGVTVSGSYAYVADYGSGLQVIDITAPESPQIVGSVDTPGLARGVAVSGSHAYVADYDSGLQVVDITNPTSPQIVGSVGTPGVPRGVAVSGSYAYVADYGFGFQVIDVTNPASPQIVVSVGTPGLAALAMAVSGTYAYVADGASGLSILPLQCLAGRTLWRVPLDAPTIQAGIDSATAGDTVEVASDTYTGGGNRDIRFYGKAITVRSATGKPEDCTIDCEASPADKHRGFVFEADEGPNSVLEGFTITGAYQNGGSGILVRSGQPRIRHCILMNNAGSDGSGIQITDTSSVSVEDCRFEGNTAVNYGGAAVVTTSSVVTFQGCEFAGNSSDFCGGAASSHLSDVAFDSCVFIDNYSPNGGALCLNHADHSIEVRGCTFYGSSATQGGSIFAANSARVVVENTIIAFGTLGPAVACIPGATVSLTCCDLYGNAGGDYVGCASGQLGIRGNISDDPLFRNAEAGDLTLDASSPCTPENSPSGCGLIGALGVRCTQVGDDADGDGVVGASDLCPSEDASGFDSDGDGCVDDGMSARHVECWDRAMFPIVYWHSEAGCPGITDDSDSAAVKAAMDSWISIQGIEASAMGPWSWEGGDAQALDGVNLLTFSDPDYRFSAGTIAVGLTTSFTEPTWFGSDCRRPGEVVDADIIFNPAMTYRTDTQGPPDGIDIESVTAHELGHFFGISHSAMRSATMYFVLQEGTGARSLEWDDEIQMVKAYGSPTKMTTASRLSGRVTNGYTSDPVSGAAVFAISEVESDTLGCEYTLLDGSYEFIGLPDGDYYVGVHPLDGSSAVSYMRPAYINDYVAAMPLTLFVPESWDSLESQLDNAGDRDPIAVQAGTTAVADIITNIDDVHPAVVATVPDTSATDVPIDAPILVSFSERLNTGTLQGNFSLTDTTTHTFVSGNAAFLNDDSLVAFVPLTELAFSSTYKLVIETGLKDLFGNGLAEDFVMHFTTEPEPDVALASLSPSKGVVGMIVALNGKGFDPAPDSNTVRFNGIQAAVSQASPTQLVVTVPEGTTSGAVDVYNATQGKTSNSLQFTVLSADEVPRGFESGTCALGATPRALTLVPDGKFAFVATDAGAVAVVSDPDSSTYMTATAIPVAGGLTDIDAGPASNRVYAVSSATEKLYRLNSTWGSVGLLSEKPIGAVPRGILVHPNGRRAFIPTDEGEIQIWDIDEASPSFETQIGLIDQVDPSVRGELAIGTAGDVLLALTGTGKMLVIDLDSSRVTDTVSVGVYPKDIAIDPLAERAYVCDETGFLSIVSLSQGAALWKVRTGGTLYSVSLTPAGKFALVVNRELNLLNAIDLRENSSSFLSVVATISLPENPVDIDLSSDGAYAFTISEAEEKIVATAVGVGPTLVSLSPQAGPVGGKLVLAGSDFSQGLYVCVFFNGVDYEWPFPERLADSSLTVRVPDDATSGMVSVGLGDPLQFESNALRFEVLDATGNDDMLRLAAALPGTPSPAQDGGSVLEVSPGGDYLAMADESGGIHALVVDAASPQYHKYVGSLTLGSNASDIAFTPDGERALVVLPDSDEVLVVGANRLRSDFLAPVDTIDFSGITGSSLARVAVSPDGFLLMVSDPGVEKVHMVDIGAGSPTEYEIIESIEMGSDGNGYVYEMAFHPGGVYAYLPIHDSSGGSIQVLDTDPQSPQYRQKVGEVLMPGVPPTEIPISLSFTPNGQRCLVLTSQYVGGPHRSILMLDTYTPDAPHVSATLSLGGTAEPVAEHLDVSPRGDRAVANVHEMGLINIEIQTFPDSLIVLQEVGGASQHLTTVDIAYAVDASKFYSLSESSDSLCVYDFSTADTIAVYSGNGQSGVVNQPLPHPLRAMVTGELSWAMAGVPVEFTVTSGGGKFAAADSTVQVVPTNADGIAEVEWTLGPDVGPGTHTVQASAAGLGGSPLLFTADGIADPEMLPLMVVSVIPDSGATGISIASATQTTFSRPVDVSTVTSSTFYLRDGNFNPVPTVIGFADADRKVSLSPLTALEPSTTYLIEITPGIKDESGGPLTEAVASGFTTEPPPPMELGSIAPASAQVGAYVVLSGDGFNRQASLNKVLFGSLEACVSAGSTDFLSVAVPIGAETGSIRVVNTAASDTSNALAFTVLPSDISYVNDVVGSVTTSSATRSVSITPDGAIAFAVSPDANKVSVIDLINFVHITSIPVGDNPVAVTVDRAGTFAYVANHLDGTVSVIDADDESPSYCEVVDVFAVGVGPTDLAVTPDGDRLAVANAGSGTISLVDADSTSETYRRVVTSIAVGSGARTVAITPDGGLIYVGMDSGYLVISAADYGVVTSIATGTGSRTVSITPDGAFLVILTTDGVVDVYDIQPGSVWENQVVTSIATGSGTTTVAISPDGGFLYLIQEVGDEILVGIVYIYNSFGVIADGQELPPYGVEVTIVDTLAVGEDPADIAFDPTGSGKVIVTTAGDRKITVLGDPFAGLEPPEPSQVMRSFPNPFTRATTIRFEIAEPTHVKLAVYDVTGRLVRTLVDADLKSDLYSVAWNGTDRGERRVASGIYFCRIEGGSFVRTNKMLLLR